MTIKLKSMKLSFTLMEFLIITAIIALLATAVLVLFNPKKQVEKAWDNKRKHELSQLQKVLEDWYNDKNCYPKPSEICFDTVSESLSCHLCGTEKTSPQISPYLSQIPCDPQHPQKMYLYQVDNVFCPSSYKIYALLSENQGQGTNYNYGVASGNTSPLPYPSVSYPTILSPTSATIPPSPTSFPTPINSPIPCPDDPANKFCLKNNVCNTCGTFSQCSQPAACNPYQLYSDYGCQNPCFH